MVDNQKVIPCFCMTYVLNMGQNSARHQLCRRLGGKDPAGAVSQPNRAGGAKPEGHVSDCHVTFRLYLESFTSEKKAQTSVP